MNNTVPIFLVDHDGLRLVNKGMANGYPFTSHHNPELIAQVVAERRRQSLIRETNFRQWG